MNRYFLVLCVLLLPNISFGQTDTIYFDSKWRKTEYDYADYYRLSTFDGKGYKVEDHYIGGKVQMTGYYISIDSDVKEGPFVYYYKNGRVKTEEVYKNNKLNGTSKEYTDSGTLLEISNFIGGIPDGRQVMYYSYTSAIWCEMNVEHGNIELTSYYKDGKIKRKEKDGFLGKFKTGTCYDEEGKEIPFTPFEVPPHPTYDLLEYLNKSVRYPLKARQKNIEGRVVIKFAVNEDGTISNAEVAKSVFPELDAEARIIVSEMPKWIPGTQDGVPAKINFMQPIAFKLK